jgi:hypothetical protein
MVGGVVSDSLMDLRSDSLDGNGFPLNPYWLIQRMTGTIPDDATLCGGFRGEGFNHMTPSFGNPACTHYSANLTSDTRYKTCQLRQQGDVSYHGHINWFPVTYTGELSFEDASEASTGFMGDKDFNFSLARFDESGVTRSNPNRELHLEIDRRETGNLWGSKWWKDLADTIRHNPKGAAALIRRRPASVLGLFGLDGVHRYVSELHPAYAIALNLNPHTPNDTASVETWEVFARHSSKNEGYCSLRPHNLDGLQSDTLTLDIAWRSGASGVTVDSAIFYTRAAGTKYIGIKRAPNRIALLFLLPKSSQSLFHAEERAMIDGHIRLRWTGLVPQPKHAASPALAAFSNRVRLSGAHVDSAEIEINTAVGRMSAAEQARLKSELVNAGALFAPPLGTKPVIGRQVVGPGESIVFPTAWPTVPVLAWGKNDIPVNPILEREDLIILASLCRSGVWNKRQEPMCSTVPGAIR